MGKENKNQKNKQTKKNGQKKPQKQKQTRQPQRQRESRGIAPGVLSTLGQTAGAFVGGAPGAAIGGALGTLFGKITGMGAYHVKSNTLMNGTQIPMFGDGAGCVMTHREFIGDVTGSVAFTNTPYFINPGNSALFPWLSLCAAQFEEYQLLGMIVEFKSTSAVALNSTNTALGTVILATDYDTYDFAFTSKQQMEAYQFSTSAAPSLSQIHPIECDPKKNVLQNLFIRSGAPSGDQRFYDVGVFQLATVGMQAASVIGELWVSYQVKFMKPKLPTPLGQNLCCAHYKSGSMPTVVDWRLLIKQAGSTCDLTWGAPTAGTASMTGLPVGRYLLVVTGLGGTVAGACAITAGSGAAAVNTAFNSGDSREVALQSSVTIGVAVMDITSAGGALTFGNYAASGTTSVDVYAVQLSS